MANTKLMREALQAIADFWREGMVVLDPYATIGDSDETIYEQVQRAVNTDEDALPEVNEGDVHLYMRNNWAVPQVEFDIRSLKAEKWCDDLCHPVKYATNPTGKGCDFRARPDDAETIISLMEQSGLDVRDYR